MSVESGPDTISGEWVFLATTNRDLEAVAIQEIGELIGADASIDHPGMVRFEADLSAVYTLHARARSLHRIMLELAREPIESIEDISGMVGRLELPTYLGPDQSFAVRAQRHGEHSFGSPDVEREVGQAVVDCYRRHERSRPPVDLDDPDLIFRVFVRDARAAIAIDATGQRSLHRRWYRVEEHEAPLRPTIAYALCRYADYEPGERLLDPMCGCGTIPIEATLATMNLPPTRNHDPALTRFQFLDPGRYHRMLREPGSGPDPPVTASDTDEAATEATRTNAREADVRGALTVTTADATAVDIETDVVVTDMPFGVRTSGGLAELYGAFFATLRDGEWDRAVVHTAREDLVPLEVSEAIPMRRGRLETSILLFE